LISFISSQRWRLSLLVIVLSVLFIAAFIPAIGVKAAPWHVEIHLLTYALVGALTYWTLARIKYYWLCLTVVFIPVMHEICEVWGHHHRLEVNDIIINLIGMLSGTLFALAVLKVSQRIQNKS
jgi:hypothetical protein